MESDLALARRLDTTIICTMPPVKRPTMHSQRNAGAYLDRAEGAGALMPKARRIMELRRTLLQTLPTDLARSCTVANAAQGRIVLYALNSAVAAKLKLLVPALQQGFLQSGVEATSVVVQVQPPSMPVHAHQKQAAISPAAAEALEALHSQLPDSELKNILQAMAARGRKNTVSEP